MKPDSSKPLNIYFLTLMRFPFGLAQTNRLISIAGGLVNAGCKVKIVCLKPTENHRESLNNQSSGVYNNINFVYASGTPFRGNNPFRRGYLFMAGLCLSSYLLIIENRKEKINFLFIGVTGFLISLWFFMLCKILRIKYLQERSEYPFIKAKTSFLDKPSLFLYLTITCKLFDGFIVITRKLRDYFKPHLQKDCPLFHLPILVEPERFAQTESPVTEQYIAYCGSMQGDKDGIPVLIDAYKLFSEEFPNVKLYLIGSIQFAGFDRLQEKIAGLSLDKSVIFTGIVNREKLPEVLSKAVMLVLARPENKQAEAGFPTKLGEYLATGKPVVVTNVGEFSVYLHDNVNAYIARPGDAEDFANKMRYILHNYEQALKVGIEGQQLAHTEFNSTYQGSNLIAWLKKI
jgi:glycosyltransferase involved in cell wall biosynthesis